MKDITLRPLEDFVAVDLETDGFAGNTIWCVGFADDQHCIVHEWPFAKTIFLDKLHNTDCVFVFQNPAFDVWVLRKHGVDIPAGRYVDTLMAAHCVNPQRHNYSLDSLAEDVGEEKMDYAQAMRDAGLWSGGKNDLASLYRVPYNPVMDAYCAQDTWVTWLLWGEYRKHFAKDARMRKSYEELHLPMAEVAMSLKGGMHIDYMETMRLATDLLAEIEADTAAFHEIAGQCPKVKWNKDTKTYNVVRNKDDKPIMQAINLNSPNDVHSMLLLNGWEPDDYKRETGKPVASQASLRRLLISDDTPPRLREIVAPFVELRSKIGIQGQLIQLLTLADKRTGMLYGNWLQHGTQTKRWSSSKPNLQNFSTRHPKLGKQVRSLFTPPPGMVLLIADLAQAELAILAYYLELLCGDSSMAEGFRKGVDAHDNNTINWYGVDRDDPLFKSFRARAKNGAFAAGYGAMANRLSLTLNIPVEEALEILNTVSTKTEINRLKELLWQQLTVQRDVEPVFHKYRHYRSGFMYTLEGTRNFYPKITAKDRWERSSAQRQSFNSLMQTGCLEVFSKLMLRTLPLIPTGGWVSNLTHDEAHIFVPEGTEGQAVVDFNRAWSGYVMDTPQGGVPLGGEWAVCSSWADK